MKNLISSKTTKITNLLWDIFCVASIIGIWPRFIEPQCLITKKLGLSIRNLPKSLKGFKVLQFSDLHLNEHVKNSFLEKLVKTIDALKPDLIVFTGDFLCYSELNDRERLHKLLCQFKAPHGCYAIFGNHDYEEYVSINDEGVYDVIENSSPSLIRGFKRLFKTTTLKKRISTRALTIGSHMPLIEMLATTPFNLLQNKTVGIVVNDAILNLCGCGEYMLGDFKPHVAFANYDSIHPGIILVHNPDAVPHLKDYPGDVVLCGHTHGGQVNLPWIGKKFTLLENMQFKKGLFSLHEKWVYVNRGIGSVIPFRWLSPPELLLLTLE
ncbi:MAG: UDP-2,3-diacylglucosamine diphosphatase LpxG [Parachlamydiaceae bacterium]|nr:UDP-2,3-diacylglucosamine diphosphatase LpxG [Parachlamydiaceae bacterium]